MQQRHASVSTVYGDPFQIYMGKQNIIPSKHKFDLTT